MGDSVLLFLRNNFICMHCLILLKPILYFPLIPITQYVYCVYLETCSSAQYIPKWANMLVFISY